MPGRFFIQSFLRRAVRAGCEYAFIEVTSQGSAFFRDRFIRFAAAAITNIAPEHIEAHGSFEKYRDTKLSFLRRAARFGAPIFINADDRASDYFKEHISGGRALLFSKRDVAGISAELWGILPGEFSKENVALVLALARRFGIGEEAIAQGLRAFRGIPGRMEFVQKEPFAVVVDYAHTPESLEAVYRALRDPRFMKHEKGKLICVLGACGGGRDKWKRPVMGAIAGRNCDEVVLTNEDPYDEDPGAIIEEIAKGIKEGRGSRLRRPALRRRLRQGESYGGQARLTGRLSRIPDRREAILEVVRRAKLGDVVVITGKGSEEVMRFEGGKEVRWSDRDAAEESLAKIRRAV